MEDSQTTISEGEWSSLGEMYTSEEADFNVELLGSYFTSNVDADAKGFAWSCVEPRTTVASADDDGSFYNSNFCYFQSSGHGDCNLSYSNHEVVPNVNISSSVNVSSDVNSLPEEGTELKGGSGMSKKERDGGGDKDGEKSGGKSKKRTRIAGNATMTKRNVKSKNKQNVGLPSIRDESDINASNHEPDLSARHPDDDSSTSKDQHNGSTSNSKDVPMALHVTNGKTRASRGSATDPQSLYARKRRERINERLRILQNLIPNGNKVDISTMLEEAVQYVKFLQVQIKLLSSDDLWMYAPIAYNGMDIGLDANFSCPSKNSEVAAGITKVRDLVIVKKKKEIASRRQCPKDEVDFFSH